MTLPFRRRHHDDDTAHDRARALTSKEMLEPIEPEEVSWLAGHLDGCAECRQEREAYLADRELLRSLRDTTPQPPRDLWARTSAALDREARTRPVRAGTSEAPDRSRGRWLRAFPLAPAAAFLVVLVVIGASIVPPTIHPAQSPGGTQAARVSAAAQPTEIAITAGRVGWVHPTANGSWELVLSNVDAVCPRTQSGCASLGGDVHGRPVALGNAPTSMTISPDENSARRRVARRRTDPEPDPGRARSLGEPGRHPRARIHHRDAVERPRDATGHRAPDATAPASPVPSSDIAAGVIEIASGVTVVGETAYTKDGHWLAFSARPSDGSTGPDLYLWHVGDPAAVPVTSDHQTYFSGWLGNLVLASSVNVPVEPVASRPRLCSARRARPCDATRRPDRHGPGSGRGPSVVVPARPRDAHPHRHRAAGRVAAGRGPHAAASSRTGRARSAGPQTGSTGASAPGASCSTAGRHGRCRRTDGRRDAGARRRRRVPSGRSGRPSPSSRAGRARSPASSTRPARGSPCGSPTSTTPRSGACTCESSIRPPARSTPRSAPLDGVLALRRFSIDTGRLAWVSPPGQDGQESSVQVLGWSHDDFGEIRTIPSKDLVIVR